MERRSFAERIFTKPATSVSPSGVARNSETWTSDGASGTSAFAPGAPGAPSKKNSTGTRRMCAICCNRLAPTRLMPFSYFWICWKVRSRPWARAVCDMPSIRRRMRMRAPTCLSVGFGVLIAIIRQFHLRERCAFQSAVKQTPPRAARATLTGGKHIAGGSIRRAQSAAELNVLDTRAYMLERLSLDFVTRQQQHKGRKRFGQHSHCRSICHYSSAFASFDDV